MKKLFSLLLAIMMIATMCWTGVWAVSAQDSTVTVLPPTYSADNINVSNKPFEVTENEFSDFTADIDYAVKADKNAFVTFDMESADWENIYFNDFNNGEVWTSSNDCNNMSNTGGALKMIAKMVNGKKWFAADPIVTDVTDFELTFDVVSVGHTYTNANFYMRNDQYVLFICGNSAAPTIDGNKAYMYFLNRTTGEQIGYNQSVSGKSVRVVSVGKTVQIYVNDVLAIDYVPAKDFTLKTGSIYATITECPITYDNVSVSVPSDGTHNPESESYYEVGLGQNVTLGRRINGVYTEIAKSETTLQADKEYNFKVVRKAGSVTVTADGNDILTAEIPYPYTEGGVSLWTGIVGLAASDNDIIDSVDIYDSTNLNFTDEYVELLPFSDALKEDFEITGQGSWNYSGADFKADATYEIKSDNEFTLISPSQTNAYAKFNNLLNDDCTDIYVTFEISANRGNHTADIVYFAGYQIVFEAGVAVSAKTPSGAILSPDATYGYFGTNTYVLEILKKGSVITVYYYPKGNNRTLLFTDNHASAQASNLSFYKRQGASTFKNFTVYDAMPINNVYFPYLNEHSLYVKTKDGVGAIPMGTTVREVRANFNYGETLKIMRDGVQLADTDTVLSGDIIGSTQLKKFALNIGTLGDLNGDGKLSPEDVELIATAYGVPAEQTAALAGADINQDGVINENDATALSALIASGDKTIMYARRSFVGDAILANFKTVGRQYYVENTGVNFEWNGASVTVVGYMKGDVTVTINMDIGDAIDEAAILVFIDGNTDPQFIHLQTGVATYTVASGLDEGYHTVQIMKNSESIMSVFYMENITFTGTPTKVADKARRIEFLGDSITAGCGALLTTDSDWYHYINETYAAVVARELAADYYAMANSGWSFADYHNYTPTINSIYEFDSNRRSPKPLHDFSVWQPDVVVINLGTNDNTAITKTLDDESKNHEANYKAAVKIMLDKVRKNNPNATIIWTYGAMGFGTVVDELTGKRTGDWIKEAVEAYAQTDSKVSFYKMERSQIHSGGHPVKIASEYLGKDLAQHISNVMNWGYAAPESDNYKYGDVVASHNFNDGTTEGIYGTKDSLVSVKDNALHLSSDNNLSVVSSAFANKRDLDAYEMSLEWKHSGASDWSKQLLNLRSPNSTLFDAIYLTFLGKNLTPADNFYNPLKKEGMNVQLVAVKDGVITELGSTNMSDLYSGAKSINVRMNGEYIEVTIWDKGSAKPALPTFAAEINADIAPTYGDIFFYSRNSIDIFDNINIQYGVTVDVVGDLDGTFELEATDVALMRKYLLGFKEDIDRFATDTNTDTVTDIRDLIRLKKLMSDWQSAVESAVVIDPIYKNDSVALDTVPITVTDKEITNFTVNADYTVTAGKTAYINFDTVNNDSYYQVNIGEEISLGRRINGVYTEIAKSNSTLIANKAYNISVIRNGDTVTVTANRKAVLSVKIAFPYTENGVSLWKGLIGFAASSNDTFNNVAVYDSAKVKIHKEYTEIYAYDDAVANEFTILSQGAWGQSNSTFIADATYNITSDSEFKFVSPSQTNGWVNFGNILNKDHADIYIKFDMVCSRDSYTDDTIHFAGYQITFESGKTPVVKTPTGSTLTASTQYGYFGINSYTFELIKKGSTITVYYYPTGTAQTLLFSDNGAIGSTNLRFYKRQGTDTVKNFVVYDAIPSGEVKVFSLSPQSAYVKTSDGVGAIPMNTTVREVKANLINGHTVNIMRKDAVLSDTDTVLSGDIIQSTQLASAKWYIGTLADLDGDGKVTSDDVTLAKTADPSTSKNSAALAGADMDRNGIISATDITELENIVTGTADMTYIKRSIVGDALLEQFKTVGRQYYQQNKGVNFEWSSASITIAGYMKGDVKITLDYDSGVEGIDDGFLIYVDGDKSSDNYTSLISGVHTYTVANGLSAGYHTIEILKNNSSAEDAFYMLSVDMTGKPEKVAPAARKIEFLGDSITAGSGVLPSDVEGSSGAHYQHYTYASVASRALGADFYAMANSGWGFANHLKYPYSIERIYELATDRRDPELAHDFSKWQPDLVVVNLGTNDNTVVNNHYNDAVKAGKQFDFAAEKAKYQASVVTLLDKIRKNNPNAKIIWTYGAMGYGLTDNEGNTTGDWIKQAVAGWNETNGGATFYRMPSSQNGGGGHPESIGSKYLGEDFAEFIAEFMNWDYTPETGKTYTDGQVVKNYTFDDGTTEGVYTNNLSYSKNSNGKLQLNSESNLQLNTNGIVDDKYFGNYEMNLEWTHIGAAQWNREVIVLRSPNSSLGTAIYLCTLGSNLAQIDNYYNPLKNTTDNVQLVAVTNGVVTKLGSASISDIFTGTNKINVKMSSDSVEVTIWKSGTEMPTTPTFSAEINEEIAPTHGDIFFESRNSNNLYDNINIVYGINN